MPLPVIPLFLGLLGLQGVSTRREKKTLMEREAERIRVLNNLDIGLDNLGGSNEFDAIKVDAMLRQEQTALGLMKSLDPEQQKIGAAMLARLDTAVRGEIQQNETEARADDVRREEAEIAAAGVLLTGDARRRAEDLKIREQLDDSLQPFMLAQTNYEKVINLLENDDHLASLAGLTAFVQSIDNSVVREGELIKYQGANGLVARIVTMMNKAAGEDFDEKTKQSVRNAAAALINAEKSRATIITNSYQARAVAFRMNVERVMSGVDRTLFSPIQIDFEAQALRNAEADAIENQFNAQPDEFVRQTGEVAGVDIPGTSKRLSINPTSNINNRLVIPFLQLVDSIGRGLRGAELFEKKDGTLWIKERNGKMRRVNNQDYINLSNFDQGGQSDAVQLTPSIQRRQRAERVRQAREEFGPGVFQSGGLFDREGEQ